LLTKVQLTHKHQQDGFAIILLALPFRTHVHTWDILVMKRTTNWKNPGSSSCTESEQKFDLSASQSCTLRNQTKCLSSAHDGSGMLQYLEWTTI